MNEFKISEELKKELNKFNLYCRATIDDKFISWDIDFYEGDDEWINGPNLPNALYGYDTESHVIKNLSYIVEEIFSKIPINDYLYCDDCLGYGTVVIDYNHLDFLFDVRVYSYIRTESTHSKEKTFNEVVNDEPYWNFGNTNYKYKKLNDDEFVESLIEDGDGNETYEITYNGYGDSGALEDNNLPASFEDIAYELIDLYFSGWENNEGSDGTIYLDLENKKFSIEHVFYLEESVLESNFKVKIV
jgi:hypothetical protein